MTDATTQRFITEAINRRDKAIEQADKQRLELISPTPKPKLPKEPLTRVIIAVLLALLLWLAFMGAILHYRSTREATPVIEQTIIQPTIQNNTIIERPLQLPQGRDMTCIQTPGIKEISCYLTD